MRTNSRVEVAGYPPRGPRKRHGCASQGIGLTPDERKIWLPYAFNGRLHIFDATVMPPKQVATVPFRKLHGWITFTRDGVITVVRSGPHFHILSTNRLREDISASPMVSNGTL